jgi:hypothetical protein
MRKVKHAVLQNLALAGPFVADLGESFFERKRLRTAPLLTASDGRALIQPVRLASSSRQSAQGAEGKSTSKLNVFDIVVAGSRNDQKCTPQTNRWDPH